MATRSLILDFDDRIRFGSREHYFHFLLGYLLPGISAATRHRQMKEVCFVSCGPVMDPLIHEACSRLKLPHRILTQQERSEITSDNSKCLCADRWDYYFAKPGRSTAPRPQMSRIRSRIVQSLLELRSDMQKACRDSSKSASPNDAFDSVCPDDSSLRRSWLLLRRSAQPRFYEDGGSAEIAGYGQGRRSIQNLESLAEAIMKAGFDVAIYEPGVQSLSHQIRTFGMAKGLIGIRGAEFANLSWMRPDSHAVMIATPVTIGETSRNLARALGIGFHSIPTAEPYPEVNPEDVLAIVRRVDQPSQSNTRVGCVQNGM